MVLKFSLRVSSDLNAMMKYRIQYSMFWSQGQTYRFILLWRQQKTDTMLKNILNCQNGEKSCPLGKERIRYTKCIYT